MVLEFLWLILPTRGIFLVLFLNAWSPTHAARERRPPYRPRCRGELCWHPGGRDILQDLLPPKDMLPGFVENFETKVFYILGRSMEPLALHLQKEQAGLCSAAAALQQSHLTHIRSSAAGTFRRSSVDLMENVVTLCVSRGNLSYHDNSNCAVASFSREATHVLLRQ